MIILNFLIIFIVSFIFILTVMLYNKLTIEIEVQPDQCYCLKTVQELNNRIPNLNLKDKFLIANSSIENGDLGQSLQQFMIDSLTNSLNLNFIVLYLLFMVLMIFTSKLILENHFNLNKIKEYPLGKYIYIIVNKYASFWQTSASMWIYFIIICVIIFLSASTYSLYYTISALKVL